MKTFQELGLHNDLIEAVDLLGFENPTKIQELAIPAILNNKRDVIALAQTGTGKTGAFGLPGLQQVDPGSQEVQMLVLSPTRELAIQIAKDLKSYAKKMKGVKTSAVYGGTNIGSQIRALENGCQVIVGTPGRTLDLINRKKLDVSQIKTLVLDEADEMLNMGFQEDLDAILATMPREKRTMLFSATMPREIEKIAGKYMDNPEQIETGERNTGAENVEHHYYMVHAKDRFEALKRIVDVHPGIYGIIFCRTRMETSDIAAKLNRDGYDVDLLNGDLSQGQRDSVMDRFRKKELQLLVATDVAARGLDVDDLTHVINYNLPDDLEVYIHRSGRTGRAGKSGISISIIHTRETRRISNLEKMSGKEFIRMEVPSGEEICGIRLLDYISTVQKADIDDKNIQAFIPKALEELADYDRETLIKRFLSVEFNQILNYYKDSRDLNVSGKGGRGGKDYGRDNENYDRCFINIGKRDGLNPVRLMGLVNEYMDGQKPDFGSIDVQYNFSFFDVEKSLANKLIDAVNGVKFEGRKVAVELSQKEAGGGKKGRGRRYSGGGRKRQRHGGARSRHHR